jgi:putative NADPH-quinone reductase
MEISVILAHPYPESFNHAIYQTVLETLKKNGHQIRAHNLYEEGSTPFWRDRNWPLEKHLIHWCYRHRRK